MHSTTNFATGSAQGAAVAHTYQVGATFELKGSNSLGIIISRHSSELYGVLLLNPTDSGADEYSYSLKHADELNIGWNVPPREKLRLKIASMVIKKPVLGRDYVILKNGRASHEQ